MAHWLGALVALSVYLNSVPKNQHGSSQTSVLLLPGLFMSFSDLLGTRHVCGTSTYMQAKHSHKENEIYTLKTKLRQKYFQNVLQANYVLQIMSTISMHY